MAVHERSEKSQTPVVLWGDVCSPGSKSHGRKLHKLRLQETRLSCRSCRCCRDCHRLFRQHLGWLGLIFDSHGLPVATRLAASIDGCNASAIRLGVLRHGRKHRKVCAETGLGACGIRGTLPMQAYLSPPCNDAGYHGDANWNRPLRECHSKSAAGRRQIAEKTKQAPHERKCGPTVPYYGSYAPSVNGNHLWIRRLPSRRGSDYPFSSGCTTRPATSVNRNIRPWKG